MTTETTYRTIERPDDAAPDSLIGRVYAAQRAGVERATAAHAEVRRLEARERAWRETIARATPDSPMHEVAAAEAGLRVIAPFIERARGEARVWALDTTQEQVDRLWAEYTRLARLLRGDLRADERHDDFLRQLGARREAYAARCRELVGAAGG